MSATESDSRSIRGLEHAWRQQSVLFPWLACNASRVDADAQIFSFEDDLRNAARSSLSAGSLQTAELRSVPESILVIAAKRNHV